MTVSVETSAPGSDGSLERVKADKEWVLYPEGNHVCNNIPHLYRPLMADWLADRLA